MCANRVLIAAMSLLLVCGVGPVYGQDIGDGTAPPGQDNIPTVSGAANSQGTRVPPVKRNRTIKVPDQTCGSGQRRVIETYQDNVLVNSQQDKCVP